MKYSFLNWENGETPTTRSVTLDQDRTITATYGAVMRLTFQSQPIGVQASVNAQPLNAGNSIELPEGTQVRIIVPSEVQG